jgi:hypothetical protein
VWFKRKPTPQWAQAAEPEAAAPKARLGWLEKRDRRRRRRKLFEEVLGWIMVPGLVYLAYLGIKAIGGVPREIVDFGNELLGIVLKGSR